MINDALPRHFRLDKLFPGMEYTFPATRIYLAVLVEVCKLDSDRLVVIPFVEMHHFLWIIAQSFGISPAVEDIDAESVIYAFRPQFQFVDFLDDVSYDELFRSQRVIVVVFRHYVDEQCIFPVALKL